MCRGRSQPGLCGLALALLPLTAQADSTDTPSNSAALVQTVT